MKSSGSCLYLNKEKKDFFSKIPAFASRDISWLHFNYRVLDQAKSHWIPLLERVRFLGICLNNLDEFLMVRFRGIIENWGKENILFHKTESEWCQLLISQLSCEIHDLFFEELIPTLTQKKIVICSYSELPEPLQKEAYNYFFQHIYDLLVPIKLEAENFQLYNIGNLQPALLVQLRSTSSNLQNSSSVQRILLFPASINSYWMQQSGRTYYVVLLPTLIQQFLPLLFKEEQIEKSVFFRIIRDTDLPVDEERDEDFLDAMREIVIRRVTSHPIYIQCAGDISLAKEIAQKLSLPFSYHTHWEHFIYPQLFFSLADLPGQDTLRHKPYTSVPIPALENEDRSIWQILTEEDVLLHVPYHDFRYLIDFLAEAADDPDVLAIRVTLYRVHRHSQVIEQLVRAAQNGKHVTAVVEVKARFDEANNLRWVSRLEEAGVIVIYGIAHLKVHAKACLIIRKEGNTIRRYACIGTGNYNERTAKIYTDLHLITSHPLVTSELVNFFNTITGYTQPPRFHLLSIAPMNLRNQICTLIQREIEWAEKGGHGWIQAKMNALTDPEIALILTRAANAGVKIDLAIRGSCILKPQKTNDKGGHIQIISILGRFLEHSRIYYFHNGGNPEIFIASADWMTRNLDNRVELMVPILDSKIREQLVSCLSIYFSQHSTAYELDENGQYSRKMFSSPIHQDVQYQIHQLEIGGNSSNTQTIDSPLSVRRSPPKTKIMGRKRG